MSKKSEIYNVENCFMFEEEDTPPKLPGNKTNSSSFCHSKIIEFRPDKPYRLSLYVQPQIRKLNLTNPALISNTLGKRSRNQENIGKLNTKTKTRNQKLTVSLFEETNETTNNLELTKSKLFKKNSSIPGKTCKSFTKSVLSEVDVNESVQKTINETFKSVSKTKQKKIRRSYEKKFKAYEPENVFEPPSDQILKEIDIKKIKKSQIKKSQKEDKEFEKWAENMNSAFDDIDKFELSISYD